jgi:hypothetical protein
MFLSSPLTNKGKAWHSLGRSSTQAGKFWKMQINMGEPYWLFDRKQVQRLEPSAIYVGDLAVRGLKGLWSDVPVAVFYTPEPREGRTNHYFGVYKSQTRRDMPTWMICDATSAAEHTWDGLEMKGEVIFSRWRHDFRSFSFGGPCVDGGPDYLRVVGLQEIAKPVRLRLVNGIFKVI